MSFSMLYFSMAWVAQSTASCCMSSDMSAFLITAFLSVMVQAACWGRNRETDSTRGGDVDGDGVPTRRGQILPISNAESLSVRRLWSLQWKHLPGLSASTSHHLQTAELVLHTFAVKLDTGGVKLLRYKYICVKIERNTDNSLVNIVGWHTFGEKGEIKYANKHSTCNKMYSTEDDHIKMPNIEVNLLDEGGATHLFLRLWWRKKKDPCVRNVYFKESVLEGWDDAAANCYFF